MPIANGRHRDDCRNRCQQEADTSQTGSDCSCGPGSDQNLSIGTPNTVICCGSSTVCPAIACSAAGDCPTCPPKDQANQACEDECVKDKRKERRNRPIGQKILELPLLPFRLLEAENLGEVLEIIEDEFPGGTTGAAATTGAASLAAVAPPPLAMFPPSGLPQPQGFQPGTFNLAQSTTSLIGGGALPSAALTVIFNDNINEINALNIMMI